MPSREAATPGLSSLRSPRCPGRACRGVRAAASSLAALMLAACSAQSGVAPADAGPGEAAHTGSSTGSGASSSTRVTRDAGHDATVPSRDAGSPDAVAHDSGPRDAARDAGGDAARDGARDATPDAGDAARDAGSDAQVDAATPTLLSLSVSPLAMTPAFSPTVFDYYVRCAAGDNALTVSATAPTGATVSIRQPVAAGPAQEETKELTALENQAIVVSVNQGPASAAYWVRCLPHDFPVLGFDPHPEAGTPPPGYYFLGDTFFAHGETGYAMVLDRNGVPVWYGRTINGAGPKAVQLLDDNTIAYIPIAGYTFGTYEGSWEIHTLDPVGVRYVTSVGMPVDTHEFRQTPDGNFLVVAVPVVTGVDMTGNDGLGANEDILDCVIQEVSPDGGLLWQWRGSKHLSPQKETTYPVRVSATTLDGGSATVIDAFHCNSLDFDESGNILVSVPNLDALLLISKATGHILWKLGGTEYNREGAPHISFVDDPDNGLSRQHYARFLPNGTISVFDDQSGTSNNARAIILAQHPEAGTASIVWEYQGQGPTGSMGSFVILPDGSRVIGWGSSAHAFTETDEAGVDLLDLTFPDGDQSYRSVKEPLSAVDLQRLREAVGPWSSGPGVVDAGGDARRD